MQWRFDSNIEQTHKDSVILVFINNTIMIAELGESDEDWKWRDRYDKSYGEMGLTWLIGGNPGRPVPPNSPWIEICQPVFGLLYLE